MYSVSVLVIHDHIHTHSEHCLLEVILILKEDTLFLHLQEGADSDINMIKRLTNKN